MHEALIEENSANSARREFYGKSCMEPMAGTQFQQRCDVKTKTELLNTSPVSMAVKVVIVAFFTANV